MKPIFLLALMVISGMAWIGSIARADICGRSCPSIPVYSISCDCYTVEAGGALRFLQTLIEYSSAHSDPITDADEHCSAEAWRINRESEIRNCHRID